MNFFCIYGCDIFSQCVLCTIYLFAFFTLSLCKSARLFRFANLECECVTLIILGKITLA
jgi:hypothetical protein